VVCFPTVASAAHIAQSRAAIRESLIRLDAALSWLAYAQRTMQKSREAISVSREVIERADVQTESGHAFVA